MVLKRTFRDRVTNNILAHQNNFISTQIEGIYEHDYGLLSTKDNNYMLVPAKYISKRSTFQLNKFLVYLDIRTLDQYYTTDEEVEFGFHSNLHLDNFFFNEKLRVLSLVSGNKSVCKPLLVFKGNLIGILKPFTSKGLFMFEEQTKKVHVGLHCLLAKRSFSGLNFNTNYLQLTTDSIGDFRALSLLLLKLKCFWRYFILLKKVVGFKNFYAQKRWAAPLGRSVLLNKGKIRKMMSTKKIFSSLFTALNGRPYKIQPVSSGRWLKLRSSK
jgi:hypothetical protein